MRTWRNAAFLLAAIGTQSPWEAALARDRTINPESQIEQARGALPAGAKTIDAGSKPLGAAPEGNYNAGTAAKTGPATPVTCNQQNASSPACYSATQQAHPAGR